MAIPDFEDGRLPPGNHLATVEEIVARFCSSSPRRAALEEPLRLLAEVAVDAKAAHLYLNGSFVTDKESPGDIDAVLILPDDFDPKGPHAARIRHLHRAYGLDIERVRAGDTEERDHLLVSFFGTDRDGVRKGLVEVKL